MFTETIATIIISGLVVSTGPVDDAQRQEYLDWGANHVHVWQADEAHHWDGIPTTVWVTEDGESLQWDRSTADWERTENVVREQVGDEPSDEPYAIDDPDTQYTNFSYWAPLADGNEPHLVMPDLMDAYQGDHFTTSEYLIRDDAHWRVLEFFRDHAIEHDQTWGVYLNGYVGYETNFTPNHQPGELREHAYGALAFGASEFVWFTYSFGPRGHDEAVQGGGSIITNGIGWERGPHWETTQAINHGLRFLSARLGAQNGLSWDEDLIEGTYSQGRLLVGRNGSEASVDGWLIRPNGVAFEVDDASITLDAGEVYLEADTPLDSPFILY